MNSRDSFHQNPALGPAADPAAAAPDPGTALSLETRITRTTIDPTVGARRISTSRSGGLKKVYQAHIADTPFGPISPRDLRHPSAVATLLWPIPETKKKTLALTTWPHHIMAYVMLMPL